MAPLPIRIQTACVRASSCDPSTLYVRRKIMTSPSPVNSVTIGSSSTSEWGKRSLTPR